MGEVWKARDTRLDRIVAIKTIRSAHQGRFDQEARTIAALNHPHICQIHDIGADYLVLEYVDGEPLMGPLPLDRAVRLAVQIASAVESAHERGILHRDLKPANIIVTARGDAKLLDFGLAKLLNPDIDVTRTTEGALVGTVAYMSPEQAEGRGLDGRSDIFAFGAVLYEMVSGRRAFPGTTTAQIVSAILRDDPAPLEVPPTFAAIVSRCLKKNAAERFASMREVRIALELHSSASTDQEPSIAVLPFANLSGDKENEYFGDGLAEEIINALAHVPNLKVTARTSAFAFRDQAQQITAIAQTLRVRTILEGSVRRSGHRVRVMAQLINAADGYHLWSERYDREMTDAFAIQDEIAQAIATTLTRRLVSGSREQSYTPTPAAYDAYLKARYHLAQLNPQAAERGRELIEQAIALDPGFALAHRERSAYYLFQALMGEKPAHEVMPRVRAAALDALAIDGSLPEAHASLGIVAGLYDYDWAEQRRRFQLALARTPVSPEVRANYGNFCLLVSGRAADGVREMRAALDADPLNQLFRTQLSLCLDASGDVAAAEAELRQVLDFNSQYFPAWEWLAVYCAYRGRLEEARDYAERTWTILGKHTRFIGLLSGVLQRLGETGRAQGLLSMLGNGDAYGAPIEFMFFHLLQGDVDAAATWAEKAIVQRDAYFPVLVRSVACTSLRSSNRWPQLAGLLNLSSVESS
jgi:serine/threonine-protein kinase